MYKERQCLSFFNGQIFAGGDTLGVSKNRPAYPQSATGRKLSKVRHSERLKGVEESWQLFEIVMGIGA